MQVLETRKGSADVIEALLECNVLDSSMQATDYAEAVIADWVRVRKQVMSNHEKLLYYLFVRT